jgi:acyl-CoA thioesterase I
MTTSRALLVLLPFGASTLLATVAHATPRQPTHVACVGDSITAGAGASDPSKNYPSLLQGLFGDGVQVENFGNSGSTMLSAPYGDKPYEDQPEFDAATTFVSSAGASAVVSVVIVLGANDSKPFNWSPDGMPKNDQQFLDDYRAMVDHFLSLTPQPVVYVGFPLATTDAPCCSISGTVIHDEEIPLIQQLAMEKHLPIIDLYTPTTDHDEYFGDGVHPNDAGYAVMAQAVYDGLQREPSVTLTSPTAGAMLPAPLTLTADALAGTVLIDSVEFFEGAVSLGKLTTPPYSLLWPAAPGTHAISATAADATGATATSEPLSVTVLAAGGSPAGGSSASAGSGGSQTAGASGSGGSAGSLIAVGGGGSPLAGGAAAQPASDPVQSSDGCGCRLIGRSRSEDAFTLFAVAGLSLARKRRRFTAQAKVRAR